MYKVVAFVVGVAVAVAPWAIGSSAVVAADRCAGSPESRYDFNGDGYPDFAVGDPQASGTAPARSGVVRVLYGTASGPGRGAVAMLRQGQQGVGGTPERDDRFGQVLQVGYFDDDRCADLAVGVPRESLHGVRSVGVVHLVFGSPDGLGRGRPGRVLRQGASGLPGASRAGDAFGAAVSATDTLAVPSLAIGAPGKDVGARDAGAVFHLTFGARGVPVEVHRWTQDTPGIPGGSEQGDRFGAALALREIGGCTAEGPCPGLVVGVPREDVHGKQDAGAINTLYGLDDGRPDGALWTEDSSGVDGSAQPGDRLGASVDAAVDHISVGVWIAAGVPGQDVAGQRDAGAVHLFRPRGRDRFDRDSIITQDAAGIAGTSAAGDRFGQATRLFCFVATRSRTYLVTGIPGKTVAGARAAGAVHLLPLGARSYDKLLTQASPGMPGTPEAGDGLGSSLASTVGARTALLVGAPRDHARGSVTVIPWVQPVGASPDSSAFTPRIVRPGKGNVPNWGARFGASLGGPDAP